MQVLHVTPWKPSAINPEAGCFVGDQVEALGAERFDLSLPSWLPRLAAYTLAVEQLRRHLQGRAVSLIHAHGVFPAGYAAVEVGRSRGIPVVLTEHAAPLSMHFRSWWQGKLARYVYQRADAVLTPSQALANEVQQRSGRIGVEVVPNCVTPLFRTTERPTNPSPRFLFVGELSLRKGLDLLLAASSSLYQMDEFPHWLMLAGDGPLRHLVKGGHHRALAGCHHHATRRAVWRLMADSDCIVVPSRCESFSMVAAEAVCSGRPVIAARCGGPEEFLPAAGLFPAGDWQALRARMKSWDQIPLGDPERFSYRRLAEQLLPSYRKLTESA